ncbi:hypothetical protein BC941DRAFT_345317 [Chlamydoabsidia padenii]|nr:hypothetical protein BC941DRAFT_345317 [Chlamydoabsidia padenii]
MNHLWMSGSELLSDTSTTGRPAAAQELWLLGCRYDMPLGTQMQHDMLEAQKEDVFTSSPVEPTQEVTTTEPTPTAVMSVLWPPDFYVDFTSRYWMTYRHNYPPIRPSHYKTDIGWGCMLRSGQSLLANALMIHFLSRQWRRTDPSDPTWKTYTKITHWFLDELSPRAPFSIHRIALLGKQLGKNIGEWFGPSTISQVIQ